ncbi:glutamine amidotransferase [Leuconostoc litchii]|uniref:Aminodeoxychorismate/anthranilate synthase component II n=1 Tax=Leuconostoc litchii TaxID=1981069 RepID=A0A6P2CMX1_9LACO|nr:aminodeoxychorismate/anthranilate synthase component II [Leuconostoc litchii]TYC46934.1 aminodeoxychorismate/anthranilate synthase component II [Leuconostoc litchii]GMA68837.1 glutamine amidotransferase [Leuconostoc litchii]
MILLVDNYDSFTYNLAQIIGTKTSLVVLRNDDERLYTIANRANGIIFSPGPGKPNQAGEMENMIRHFAYTKPMLGICLGHQAIGEVFGGQVQHASVVRHGKVSKMVNVCSSPLLSEDMVQIMRYHSLILDKQKFPKNFEVTGISADDNEVMAMQHESLPIYGFQFHPESIGTPMGTAMIEKFIALTECLAINN